MPLQDNLRFYYSLIICYLHNQAFLRFLELALLGKNKTLFSAIREN